MFVSGVVGGGVIGVGAGVGVGDSGGDDNSLSFQPVWQ